MIGNLDRLSPPKVTALELLQQQAQNDENLTESAEDSAEANAKRDMEKQRTSGGTLNRIATYYDTLSLNKVAINRIQGTGAYLRPLNQQVSLQYRNLARSR